MNREASSGSILIAEDDDAARKVLTRALTGQGFSVHAVGNGDDAATAFENLPIDLVLSDIDMPGRNGVELLRAIRQRDLDVPVVLLTGRPTLETAISAVEHGASHYLTKPIDLSQLLVTVRRALQAGRLARARRQLVELGGDGALQISDIAGLGVRFDQALSGLFMVWQPIIRWSNRSTFAYEALVRSSEPTIPSPGALFDAGDRLGRTAVIGRRVRSLCAETIQDSVGERLFFVNVHPQDLVDETFYEPAGPLTRFAHHIVLEITERARLETVPNVSERIVRLRSLGYRIAIDDIGAGYAGLTSFAALEPEFMKLDGALVRDIDRSKTKLSLVGAMTKACADLGVQIIGEGVETTAERDALLELGCDLLQGFLFARPAPPFAAPIL